MTLLRSVSVNLAEATQGADAGRKGRLGIGYWRFGIGDWGAEGSRPAGARGNIC